MVRKDDNTGVVVDCSSALVEERCIERGEEEASGKGDTSDENGGSPEVARYEI